MSEVTLDLGRGKQVSVRENIIDRVVRYINPVSARRRLHARLSMEATSAYKGASKSRRALAAYNPGGGTADGDLLPDLPILRDRSRDLVRNEALAGGAINTVCTSVVGTGLMLSSQIDAKTLKLTADQARDWQRQAELEFELWGGTPACDVTRTQNFYELQDLAFRATLADGDCFCLTPHEARTGWPYSLTLQLIEADRVANPRGQRDTPTMAAGVEMNERGAPIRYHIYKEHPLSIYRRSSESVAVDAFGSVTGRRQVLHIFKRLRIGQTRGEPYLAPVIEIFKQLGRYSDAEVAAAVLASFMAITTETEAGAGIVDPLASATTGQNQGGSDSRPGWDGEMSSGLVVDLAKGETIASPTPGRPNPAFEPFVEALLRQIGMRLELPFEVLIKHFSSSYSASKAALLEAWRFFKVRRAWLAAKFCQPVYELFLDEAIARGRLAAPGYFDDPLIRMAYSGAIWHGDGPGSLDPLKEANAAEKRIAIGLTSRKQEKAEYDGGDWEATHEQLVLEQQRRQKDGLRAEKEKTPAATEETEETDTDRTGQEGSDAPR